MVSASAQLRFPMNKVSRQMQHSSVLYFLREYRYVYFVQYIYCYSEKWYDCTSTCTHASCSVLATFNNCSNKLDVGVLLQRSSMRPATDYQY
jgi:hypothetical protein